jgi:hypothetical protein
MSHNDTAWEISMPFAKSLPDAPWSPGARTSGRIDGDIVSSQSSPTDSMFTNSQMPSPAQEPFRRTIPGSVLSPVAETVALAMYAGGVLPNVPIAILSWLIVECLAEYVACAQAIYSIVWPLAPLDRGDPVRPVAPQPRT